MSKNFQKQTGKGNFSIKTLPKEVSQSQIDIHRMLEKCASKLENSPEGKLVLSSSRGNPQYYYASPGQNSRGKYLRKSDSAELIQTLVQRDYYHSVLKLLKKYEYQLSHNPKSLYPDLDEIYNSLPYGRKCLVEPVIPPIDKFIQTWYEDNPGSLNPFPVDCPFTTERGETVRSKSEKIIADKLYHLGIPYVVEPKLTLKYLGPKYPDFLVLNKRTRKSFYWEHMGKCDDANYGAYNIEKLFGYESSGIEVGKDLIITMETKSHPITTESIEKKIKDYLL